MAGGSHQSLGQPRPCRHHWILATERTRNPGGDRCRPRHPRSDHRGIPEADGTRRSAHIRSTSRQCAPGAVDQVRRRPRGGQPDVPPAWAGHRRNLTQACPVSSSNSREPPASLTNRCEAHPDSLTPIGDTCRVLNSIQCTANVDTNIGRQSQLHNGALVNHWGWLCTIFPNTGGTLTYRATVTLDSSPDGLRPA